MWMSRSRTELQNHLQTLQWTVLRKYTAAAGDVKEEDAPKPTGMLDKAAKMHVEQ